MCIVNKSSPWIDELCYGRSVLRIISCIHIVFVDCRTKLVLHRSNLQLVSQLFSLPIEQSPVLNLLFTALKKTQWLINLQSLCIVSESVTNIVQTPLTAAARKGDIQEVLKLLRNGEDPNPSTVYHFHYL